MLKTCYPATFNDEQLVWGDVTDINSEEPQTSHVAIHILLKHQEAVGGSA